MVARGLLGGVGRSSNFSKLDSLGVRSPKQVAATTDDAAMIRKRERNPGIS